MNFMFQNVYNYIVNFQIINRMEQSKNISNIKVNGSKMAEKRWKHITKVITTNNTTKRMIKLNLTWANNRSMIIFAIGHICVGMRFGKNDYWLNYIIYLTLNLCAYEKKLLHKCCWKCLHNCCNNIFAISCYILI